MGVVGDVRNQGLESEPKKQVYLPMRQSPSAGMALVARTERDPGALAGTIQRVIWDVDPQQPIYELSTVDQILARAVFLPRLSTTLLALFALAALLLAALGIYGVLSYSVSERTKEIGLRLALGASGGDTVALVMRRSVALVATGGAVGLVAAVLLARSLAGVLYGVGPVRPAVVRGGRGGAAHRRRRRQPAAGAAHRARRPDGGAPRVVASPPIRSRGRRSQRSSRVAPAARTGSPVATDI